VRLSATEALRRMLEDEETIRFIRSQFSRPEEKPTVLSHLCLVREEPKKWRWRIFIIEKNRSPRWKGKLLASVAYVELDARDGKILGRRYLNNLFAPEITGVCSPRPPLPAGCKVPRM
jgi:hypothetical protein